MGVRPADSPFCCNQDVNFDIFCFLVVASVYRRSFCCVQLPVLSIISLSVSNQESAMQMNGCRHLVPLYPYHATNYSY